MSGGEQPGAGGGAGADGGAGKVPDWDRVRDAIKRLEANVGRAIIGKAREVRLALVALLARGHLLIEDVPGTGKTLLAKAIARSLDARFKRVQFTPDLLPADITGVSIFDPRDLRFEFRRGPVFTDILLADEINRATPRTQSALLECMQERQVTADGATYPLDQTFFVVATQNPIEQHGTFPLPEAQLDRFTVSTGLGYPGREGEIAMLDAQAEAEPLEGVMPVLALAELALVQRAVRQTFVESSIKRYIVDLVEATRAHREVALGASPRGSLALLAAAQAFALLEAARFVVPDHVQAVAHPVLDHRIVVQPRARLSGVKSSNVTSDVLRRVPVPIRAS